MVTYRLIKSYEIYNSTLSPLPSLEEWSTVVIEIRKKKRKKKPSDLVPLPRRVDRLDTRPLVLMMCSRPVT